MRRYEPKRSALGCEAKKRIEPPIVSNTKKGPWHRPEIWSEDLSSKCKGERSRRYSGRNREEDG